jgi:hypothetical protein
MLVSYTRRHIGTHSFFLGNIGTHSDPLDRRSVANFHGMSNLNFHGTSADSEKDIERTHAIPSEPLATRVFPVILASNFIF